jgi:hypothetical protein
MSISATNMDISRRVWSTQPTFECVPDFLIPKLSGGSTRLSTNSQYTMQAAVTSRALQCVMSVSSGVI